MALSAYLAAPDSEPEVAELARTAVTALDRWREGTDPTRALADVREVGLGFVLAVDVGGRLFHPAGERGRQLGRVIGKCVNVVLAPENPRHVRSLGEAAEGVCGVLGVAEDTVCRAVTEALVPYVLPGEPLEGAQDQDKKNP